MKNSIRSTQEALITITHGSPDGTKGFGDQLYAAFDPALGANLRTAHGRRRLRRFINDLQDIADSYEARYAK